MLRPIYAGVTFLTFSVQALFAEELNVARGSSCCASSQYSEAWSCEKGIDGTTSAEYSSLLQGVGLWYKLDLKRLYHVTRLRIMDRNNASEKNKDLRLTFSDGSTQVVTFLNSGHGKRWTDFHINPVSTYSVTIEVISVWASGNNGFCEVEVYADISVIPTAQVEVCPHKVVGDVPISQDTWAAVRRNKQCMLTCAITKACSAALFHVDIESCSHYHLDCVADKVNYGQGYIMWRPHRI